MEDYYEYLDSNGVTTLYKLIKDDTVALIDSYSVTINGITTTLDNHVNNADIHTPIATIEGMIDTAVGSLNYATPDYVDTKVADLVNSSPETLDTLKELSDALGNDSNFATTVANQIGSKADKDDVYTKGETDTLLEGKANSEHSHVVNDITDFPTIPTKVSELTNDSGYITSVSWEDVTSKPELSQVAISGSYSDLSDTPIIPTKTSQLINDSGFLTSSNGLITSVSWSDITNKPNFSTVATSGSYTDLSNTPTIPTKVSQLENDMGFGTGGDTSDCVHKTGDETIDGTKTFTSILKISQGTLQVGSDAGYSVTYSWTGDIISKQPSGTFNISLPKANGTLAIDDNLVHRSGNETIAGSKSFTEVLDRRNDVTISTVATATQLVDTNANRCGWIANRMHWSGNYHVHNRHIAYNENSGKEVYIDIISSNDGSGGLFVSGTAINRNLYDVTSETGHTGIATMGWANNPATSTNIVHRSGDETIGGAKIFYNTINRHSDLTTSTVETVYKFEDTNAKPCGHIYNNVHWYGNAVFNRHGAYNAKSGKSMEIDIISNNDGVGVISVEGSAIKGNLVAVTSETGHAGIATMGWVNNPATSTNVVHRSGNETILGAKTFINNVHCYSLKHPTDDSYFFVSGGTDWNKGATLYLGGTSAKNFTPGRFALAARKTDGSSVELAGSPDGTLTWGGQDIATTAWVKTYVNSVVGSGSVGASISAYYSNATTLTAEGNSSTSTGPYPADYSNYINIAPTVGTIYTGSQLFSSFTPTASGTIFRPPTGSGGTALYQTTAKATANFSGAFSASAKYLCTTANAVKFRAYVSQGTSSSMGSPSVVDNSSAKSIFIRVQ